MEWIHANRDLFDPRCGGSSFQGAAGPEQNLREKALVELALALMYLRANPLLAGDPRLNDCLAFVLDVYTRPAFRDRLYRVIDVFVPYALLSIVLHACGALQDQHERTVLQGLIDRSNLHVSERPPHRTLELRYLLDLGRYSHRLPSYRTLYKSSILSHPVDLVHLTDRDVYCMTHVVFYVTHFGTREPGLPEPETVRILTLFEQLLGMYTYARNWDVVGELLLSCSMLGCSTTESYGLAWRALAAAQAADGAVPGPRYDERDAAARDVTRQRDYAFEKCYHTTLVASLAGALCL